MQPIGEAVPLNMFLGPNYALSLGRMSETHHGEEWDTSRERVGHITGESGTYHGREWDISRERVGHITGEGE